MLSGVPERSSTGALGGPRVEKKNYSNTQRQEKKSSTAASFSNLHFIINFSILKNQYKIITNTI